MRVGILVPSPYDDVCAIQVEEASGVRYECYVLRKQICVEGGRHRVLKGTLMLNVKPLNQNPELPEVELPEDFLPQIQTRFKL